MKPPLSLVCVPCGFVGSAQTLEMLQLIARDHHEWCWVQQLRPAPAPPTAP
jgi:hypothetical protein